MYFKDNKTCVEVSEIAVVIAFQTLSSVQFLTLSTTPFKFVFQMFTRWVHVSSVSCSFFHVKLEICHTEKNSMTKY